VPARPKCLTGVERRDLQALVALDPLHRLRPLTTLRALAFEPVQAGILNRQRRGAGGPSAAARASACDAPAYPDLAAGLGRLRDHLRDVLRIALALRLDAGADGPDDPRAAAVAAEGRRLLKTLRREGFDAPVLELRQALAGIDGDLAALAGALDDALGAIAALDGARPLAARFAADRAIFAALFTALYADPSAQEALDGTP
jgi:hypothetical protein